MELAKGQIIQTTLSEDYVHHCVEDPAIVLRAGDTVNFLIEKVSKRRSGNIITVSIQIGLDNYSDNFQVDGDFFTN